MGLSLAEGRHKPIYCCFFIVKVNRIMNFTLFCFFVKSYDVKIVSRIKQAGHLLFSHKKRETGYHLIPPALNNYKGVTLLLVIQYKHMIVCGT